MKTKLNLGCGKNIRDPDVWINHDINHHDNAIMAVHDLNITPWPWEDNSFEEIAALSVFEHLRLTLIESLNECWRIICPQGVLALKYPLFTSPHIHDDPTHIWFWSDKVLEFVDPDYAYGKKCDYYTEFKWRILERYTDSEQKKCWATLRKRI